MTDEHRSTMDVVRSVTREIDDHRRRHNGKRPARWGVSSSDFELLQDHDRKFWTNGPREDKSQSMPNVLINGVPVYADHDREFFVQAVEQSPVPLVLFFPLGDVDRFEVITSEGRELVRYGVNVRTELQDGGRTLKVFLAER